MSNHTPATTLGIDIGGSAIKLAKLVGGGLAATHRGESYQSPTIDQLRQQLITTNAGLSSATSAQAANQPTDQATDQVAAIGVSVPGPVDPNGTVIQAGNLQAIEGLDVGQWVAQTLGLDVPVLVSTDALAGAVGAALIDPMPGRVLYLALGTGVGGALLDDGQPVTFTRGTPGHIGHIDVSGGNPDAPSTPAAGRGALEAYLGAPALRAAGLNLDDVAACANHPAMARVNQALARAIRILLALYRMDHVVLIGGLSGIFEPGLAQVRGLVNDALTTAAPSKWTLSTSDIGPFAAAVGAAKLAQGQLDSV